LRPPVAADRLRLTETGQVVLALRQRWRDGTTDLLFDPIELLERLAALPRGRASTWCSITVRRAGGPPGVAVTARTGTRVGRAAARGR
jgi:hypothetical protein